MKRWLAAGTLSLLTTCALLTSCASGNTRPVSADDEQAVGDAAAKFYSALNVMFSGDAGPMKDVWSHAADVTYMGPGGGLTQGGPAVLAVWEAQAALKLGGHVQSEDLHITVGEDLAITNSWERGQNIGPDGRLQVVSIRATNVFRKEGGSWKMIGHHTDLLPFLVK